MMPWRWLALASAAIVAIGALLGWGEGRERAGYRAGSAAVRTEWQAADLVRAAAAARAQEAARIEEQRRAAAHQEVVDAYQAQLQRARADAVVAAAAAGRLQQRVAALLAAARDRAAAGDPAPSAGSPAADDAAGVLADVLGRCVERVRRLAEVADERGAAGAACEQAYDSLTVAGGAAETGGGLLGRSP